MNTFERVRQILAEVSGVREETITPQTVISALAPPLHNAAGSTRQPGSIVDSLNADSLMLVEFVMALEEEGFDIEIPDAEAETFLSPAFRLLTVQDIVNWIEGNKP